MTNTNTPTAFFLSFLLSAFLFLVPRSVTAQITVALEINSVDFETTCVDAIFGPNPTLGISINGSPFAHYDNVGICFPRFPAVVYTDTFPCLADIPQQMQACIRVFENDPSIFSPCSISRSCAEDSCFTLPIIPMDGQQSFAATVGDTATTQGIIDATLTVNGVSTFVDNDFVCQAFDLGTVDRGTENGDPTLSTFNNFCATNTNDADPFVPAAWTNDQGVWFTFQTDNDPGSIVYFKTYSDPEGAGDPINVESAIYTSDDGTCTGNLQFVESFNRLGTDDAVIQLNCPEPNTRYFVLVDGRRNFGGGIEGYFSAAVENLDYTEGGDRRCEHSALGVVPDGGSAELPEPITNVCSSGSDDPFIAGFSSQRSVWVSFIPPATGHVLLEVISDTSLIFPIGAQIAYYSTTRDTCTSFFRFLGSSYNNASLDESMELSCLDPNTEYFVLIDGDGGNTTGAFTVRVTDLGDNSSYATQDVTICAGAEYTIFNTTHSTTGTVQDTFVLPSGCDSIVTTNLTVLDSIGIQLTVDQVSAAIGAADGQITATATGGNGTYTFAWNDGQTGDLGTSLIGDQFYCLVVTDDLGCSSDTCFRMPFLQPLVPTLITDSLRCFDTNDGRLRFSAFNGEPPYQYSWESTDGLLSGTGTLASANALDTLSNLPEGDYTIRFTDPISDTLLTFSIGAPRQISVVNQLVTPPSCFGVCDGAIEVEISGGVLPYTLSWSDGSTANELNDRCAGTYQLTVTDANQCSEMFAFELIDPEELTVEGIQSRTVGCFGASDGQLTVSTANFPLASYEWSLPNAGNTAVLDSLPTGIYAVTVTDDRGCLDTLELEVTGPPMATAVSILVTQPISCAGDATAALLALADDGSGAADYSFVWSTGQTGNSLLNLPQGTYSVTATSNRGCSAENRVTLTDPPPFDAFFTTVDYTCLEEANEGSLTVDGVDGATGPYAWSADGFSFTQDSILENLPEGASTFFVRDSLGCVLEYPILINTPPDLTVSLGADRTVQLGEPVQISAVTGSVNAAYEWSSTGDFTLTNASSIESIPSILTTYQVRVVDTLTQCTVTDEVVISVNAARNVFLPNAFSPNGDGNNDVWKPFLSPAVDGIKKIQIFDRWGNLVYHYQADSADEVIGWDGSFRGSSLDPGVFVVSTEVVFIDGQTERFTGDITLVR